MLFCQYYTERFIAGKKSDDPILCIVSYSSLPHNSASQMKQLQLLQQQEAARAIEARDSATERQQMIDTLRSIEWTQWACAKGIFK